jgi:hypothetical protein
LPPRNPDNHGGNTANRVDRRAAAAACHAPILRRGRTVRLLTALLFPCFDPPL